jgi:hypothetical protein
MQQLLLGIKYLHILVLIGQHGKMITSKKIFHNYDILTILKGSNGGA